MPEPSGVLFRWRRYYSAWVTEKWTPYGPLRVLTVYKESGRDGITWDKLQEIKNAVLGADSYCIEVYPPAADLVYEENRRHLWEMPVDWPRVSLKR